MKIIEIISGFPSPSRSQLYKSVITVLFNAESDFCRIKKLLGMTVEFIEKVTLKTWSLEAVRLLTVTEIGLYPAPAGTEVVILVAEEAVTRAFTEPKKTVFPDGVVLKLFPVMVITVPMAPEEGLNELITGWAIPPMLNRKNKMNKHFLIA